MNRETFYAEMAGGKNLDYEIYLNTEELWRARSLLTGSAIRTNCNFKWCIKSKSSG